MNTFGRIAFDARWKAGRTLRDTSRALNLPLGILSKIERGVDPAPSDTALLAAWADLLALEGSARADFMAAAKTSAEAGPAQPPTEADIDEHLPIFIRVPPGAMPKLREGIRETLTPTALLRSA